MSFSIPIPEKPLMLSELEDYVLSHWDKKNKISLAFCAACEESNLKAIEYVAKQGIIYPVLVGNKKKVMHVMEQNEIHFDDYELINSETPKQSVCISAKLVAEKRVEILMRGRILMHNFLKCLLGSEFRRQIVPKGNILSHVSLFENENLPRVIIVSDSGIVLKPDLAQKVKIVKNTIEIAHLMGLSKPKVALLAAVETVVSGMPASLEDAIISKMADRGQIKDAMIDGPLSLDGALNPEAAKGKGIGGPVAGHADILIVDKIEVGNAIYKALIVFGNSLAAGIAAGAKIPIVITSRSDSLRNKILSIYLGILASASGIDF